MNQYILTLILNPDLDDKAREEVLKSVTARFGKVIKEDLWGNRDLIYSIKKQKKGYFAHYEFESDPSTIFDLDKNLKLDEDVLRYLLFRTNK